jgi:hypothetical protein
MTQSAIIDIHTHFLDYPEFDDPFLSMSQERGIKLAISCLGLEGDLQINPTIEMCRACNDKIVELMPRFPDMLYPFCFINPLNGKDAIDEIRRCVEDHGMSGIKLWVACRANNEAVYPIAEEAIRLDIPILQHSFLRHLDINPGESKPEDVAELARRYPDMKMIMAHMGFFWRRGVMAVQDCPNVRVDTSGFDPENGSADFAVETLGVDRVLFGSDGPGRDLLYQLGKVMAAKLSDEQQAMVLSGNAQRLLGRA